MPHKNIVVFYDDIYEFLHWLPYYVRIWQKFEKKWKSSLIPNIFFDSTRNFFLAAKMLRIWWKAWLTMGINFKWIKGAELNIVRSKNGSDSTDEYGYRIQVTQDSWIVKWDQNWIRSHKSHFIHYTFHFII